MIITQPHAASAQPTDPDRDRAERHLRMLAELAEIGMELARVVQGQALAAAAADPAVGRAGVADLGLVFSRVARAVRQTVALEARIAEDRRTQAAVAEQAAAAERDRKRQRKDQVSRAVVQAIKAEADEDEDKVDALTAGLWERLADDDADADLDDRPVGEIIARICRDLGIPPDWSGWHDGEEPPDNELRIVLVRPDPKDRAEALESYPPPVAGPDTS